MRRLIFKLKNILIKPTKMKRILFVFALVCIVFNGYSQFPKSIINPYTIKINYKNGDKLKYILYDVGNNELFLIKENSKILENQLDSLDIINVKLSLDIVKLTIRRKKLTAKKIIINSLIGATVTTASLAVLYGYNDVRSSAQIFILSTILHPVYNGIGYFFSGEIIHSFELEDGLPDEDLYRYCLKRQLNTQRILKGK